jgi:hypothetical protein
MRATCFRVADFHDRCELGGRFRPSFALHQDGGPGVMRSLLRSSAAQYHGESGSQEDWQTISTPPSVMRTMAKYYAHRDFRQRKRARLRAEGWFTQDRALPSDLKGVSLEHLLHLGAMSMMT